MLDSKPTMQIPFIISVVISILLASCSTDSLFRQYDNPTIRRLQEKETRRHFKDDSARASIARQVEQRTSFVYTSQTKNSGETNSRFGGARACAVTADGYFLTAYHVVEDAAFHLETTEMIRKPPAEGFPSSEMHLYFSRKQYPGRLVWHNLKLDLAILKFPVRNWPHFKKFKVSPEPGELVVSADDEGYGIVVPDERGYTDSQAMIGNGKFFAAGLVKDTAKHDADSRSIEFSTTLVARGGMSGAPLVTTNQELCGIAVLIKGLSPFQTPRTIATMIKPSFMFEIIESDRQQLQVDNTE